MESTEEYASEQQQCRLLGEEKSDDAVWNIYMKKVRYQRPSAIVQIIAPTGENLRDNKRLLNGYGFSSKSDDAGGGSSSGGGGGEITHLMWESVRLKVLKAGTLKKVIEAIANEDSDLQATHLSVFLATYRAFATSSQVLDEIIDVYKASKSSQNCEIIQKAMLDCLNVWLDSYSEDFEKGTDGYDCLQKTMMLFAQEENLKSLCLKVQYKLRAKRKMKKSTSLHSLSFTSVQIKTYSLPLIPESHFAQQLTYIDKEHFINLRVWECIGSIWKRRGRGYGCITVQKSIENFNSLSGRVVASILLDPNATLQQRAKYLDKWIRISQELRHLKNFSSLKSIISGLESNPIFRLSKIWHLLSKERLTIFSQLSQIFNEENNRMAQRNLLEVEGTAKYSTPDKPQKEKKFLSRMMLKGGQGVGSRQSTAENEGNGSIGTGTIPYLGTFLTDLTFLDAAIPDKINGLINFEKRKKEFEILAQLKLLQGSARGYRVDEDPYFTTWFNSLLVLDEKAAYEESLKIQPERNADLRNYVKGHRKNDSYTSNSSSENTEVSIHRKGSIPSSSESSSMLYGATGSKALSTSNLAPNPDQALVVKVSSPTRGDIMYKSIMVGNSDHTPRVLEQALEKLGLEEEDPRNYNLFQLLPHKELKFPSNANIYYALDNSQPADIRLEIRPNNSNNNFNNGTKNNSISKNSSRSN